MDKIRPSKHALYVLKMSLQSIFAGFDLKSTVCQLFLQVYRSSQLQSRIHCAVTNPLCLYRLCVHFEDFGMDLFFAPFYSFMTIYWRFQFNLHFCPFVSCPKTKSYGPPPPNTVQTKTLVWKWHLQRCLCVHLSKQRVPSLFLISLCLNASNLPILRVLYSSSTLSISFLFSVFWSMTRTLYLSPHLTHFEKRISLASFHSISKNFVNLFNYKFYLSLMTHLTPCLIQNKVYLNYPNLVFSWNLTNSTIELCNLCHHWLKLAPCHSTREHSQSPPHALQEPNLANLPACFTFL